MQKTRLRVKHHQLEFKVPAKTSRDTLSSKDTYFIELSDETNPDRIGLGECSPIWGLSVESKVNLESKLKEVAQNPDYFLANMSLLKDYPSLLFGLETAQLDFNNPLNHCIFNNNFFNGTDSIPINGLIWMGELDYMMEQLQHKFEDGYSCIKLKIGAIDFNDELKILEAVRNNFNSKEIILRVDANGAFDPKDCKSKLNELSAFNLHSIEQPIKSKQWEALANLCINQIVPIALDEELIGIKDPKTMTDLLDQVRPQYLVLKPSLLGGFKSCETWIKLAEERNIGWWITSALESNIGLNAIAQWTANLNISGHQGLGTGGLYTNNIKSPLFIEKGSLWHKRKGTWGDI